MGHREYFINSFDYIYINKCPFALLCLCSCTFYIYILNKLVHLN